MRKYIILLLCASCQQPCYDKDLPVSAKISNDFLKHDKNIIIDAINEWNEALSFEALRHDESKGLKSFTIKPVYWDNKKGGNTNGGTCDIKLNISTIDSVFSKILNLGHSGEKAADTRDGAFKMTTMHELGHSLGATRHVKNKNALMHKSMNFLKPLVCIDDSSVELICERIKCTDDSKGTCE